MAINWFYWGWGGDLISSYINEEIWDKRGTLTDYSWCPNAHDVTAFGEEQVQFFHCVWTVATLFGLRVVEKKHMLMTGMKVTVLYAYHFSERLSICCWKSKSPLCNNSTFRVATYATETAVSKRNNGQVETEKKSKACTLTPCHRSKFNKDDFLILLGSSSNEEEHPSRIFFHWQWAKTYLNWPAL